MCKIDAPPAARLDNHADLFAEDRLPRWQLHTPKAHRQRARGGCVWFDHTVLYLDVNKKYHFIIKTPKYKAQGFIFGRPTKTQGKLYTWGAL